MPLLPEAPGSSGREGAHGAAVCGLLPGYELECTLDLGLATRKEKNMPKFLLSQPNPNPNPHGAPPVPPAKDGAGSQQKEAWHGFRAMGRHSFGRGVMANNIGREKLKHPIPVKLNCDPGCGKKLKWQYVDSFYQCKYEPATILQLASCQSTPQVVIFANNSDTTTAVASTAASTGTAQARQSPRKKLKASPTKVERGGEDLFKLLLSECAKSRLALVVPLSGSTTSGGSPPPGADGAAGAPPVSSKCLYLVPYCKSAAPGDGAASSPPHKDAFLGWVAIPSIVDLCVRSVSLNRRTVNLVLDLDETLIKAYTINGLKRILAEENNNPSARMWLGDLDAFAAKREISKPGEKPNQAKQERFVGSDGKPGFREVIRMYRVGEVDSLSAVFTCVDKNPKNAILIFIRQAWLDLRRFIEAHNAREDVGNIETYVCTTAEREYALECWRLLDPKNTLIPSSLLSQRLINVDHARSRKFLPDVLQLRNEHEENWSDAVPLTFIVDDRTDVWRPEDRGQIIQVQPYTPQRQSRDHLLGVIETLKHANKSIWDEIERQNEVNVSQLENTAPAPARVSLRPVSEHLVHARDIAKSKLESAFTSSGPGSNRDSGRPPSMSKTSSFVFRAMKLTEEVQKTLRMPNELAKAVRGELDALGNFLASERNSKQLERDEATSMVLLETVIELLQVAKK
eukprot:CAMPEP_0198247140 /NCGR_PEP_ID=MMETSP1446-20131203/46320_1 /TAXON_ID=1461542 ORGANISM="Unidentified sp, Strain CCMP2111" /NCGR_SAMPLE_ID=MMETSP1446 /ASSEMBLY_ACC=CAM_ASM_001112 /LENGTH=683 /DNA_ID=CAMNT_0043931465 /DNA_START=229 /DNA_END=2280 /DNA_ORIENTATION=-